MSDDVGRAVVLVSGGMDSATAALEARARGYDLQFVHATYGQRTADQESACARRLADLVDAAFEEVSLDYLADLGGSSLTDTDRAVEDVTPGGPDEGVPSTYVPFRNANLLAVGVAVAEVCDCEAVFVGAHGEGVPYPDVTPAFFAAFQRVVDVGTGPETDVSVEAPFADGSKADVARRGVELGVPFEDTWSCYRSETPACGTCDACVSRLTALRAAGVTDPIEYEHRPETG
jgi:7-cyano-7-deazaguanine synthase